MNKLLLLTCLLSLTACSNSITGTYEGQGTGVRSMFGTAKLELKSGGTCYATIMGQTQAGTYETDRDKLLFIFGSAKTTVGIWSGDTLMVDGIAFLRKD